MAKEIRIALAGNPNSGKTTLFNNLTGSNQFVGNWPGVTVEKKEGKLKKHSNVTITDLPGIYSLSPYTLEEVVARNYLIEERPDAILNIVDGTNLERNLYLTTQLTELGIPVVVAVNMMDVVKKNGDKINTEELARQLGCKVVEISALKGDGCIEAAEEAMKASEDTKTVPMHSFYGVVEHALAHIEEAALHDMPDEQQRWYAIKVFERDEKVLEKLAIPSDKLSHIETDIKAAETEMDDDAESIITNERYIYIASILKGSYKKKSAGKLTVSDKIDKIVTNRILALPIFALVMFVVYSLSMGTSIADGGLGIGTFLTDWTNDVLGGEWMIEGSRALLESWGASGWVVGLISDGIVAGVGAVLGFVPQMLVLFLMLCILEDIGYMARIAFIMDRIFRKFGLSGKSFIPMLIGSGCGVPAVMSTRTIENERDRRMTIMTTCFIPCGAKLPIIALITAALFNGSWWVAPSCYFLGMAVIILSGIILKKTKMFAGEPAPFVMELPSYHMPTFGSVMRSMWERGWSFIKKAGTIILLSSIVIWLGTVFGNDGSGFGFNPDLELEDSVLGAIGKGIAWIFAPLGFNNIKATIATIMGLVAKEEVVGVFGVLDFEGMSSALAGYSFLAFNLLCVPCFAALGAIKREMNSRKWFWGTVAFQLLTGYVVALIIYQIGRIFTAGVFGVWTVIAVLIVIAIVYLLVRPYKESMTLDVKIKAAKN